MAHEETPYCHLTQRGVSLRIVNDRRDSQKSGKGLYDRLLLSLKLVTSTCRARHTHDPLAGYSPAGPIYSDSITVAMSDSLR